jgi:hypothetical protein
MNRERLGLRLWAILLVVGLLVGCQPRVESSPTSKVDLPAPEQALPAADTVPGWFNIDEPRAYNRENLFDFMNGAAELYFTYGFESLAVGNYRSEAGQELRVEIYRTATDADAYGLYTYNAFGEPLDIGIDGRWTSGVGLGFWQHRTFVQVMSRDEIEDASLSAFGEAVASALPQGGVRPALVEALPSNGLQPDSVRFFHEQMALENFLWLGTENVLGLGSDVKGLLASYNIEDQQATLLLVTYPQPARARDARSGLERAEVDDLIAVEVEGSAFGAVFGQLDKTTSAALLEQALATVR